MMRNRRSGSTLPRCDALPKCVAPAVLICLLLAIFITGCDKLRGPKYPTLIPTEYVPTAIALTVEAGRPASPTPIEITAVDIVTAASPNIQPSSTPPAGATATSTGGVTPPQPATGEVTPSATASPRLPTPTRSAGGSTQAPLPTATVAVPPGTAENTPTAHVPPTVTPTIRYVRTPTPSETPGIPNATILIYNPGPMSKEISPIQFSASLQPGPSGQVLIELVGEGGRNLYRKLIRFTTHDWVLISEDVEFSIAAAAESARLQISTDDEHGRIMSLASVDLLLLKVGDDDLNPPTDLLEPLIIREPIVNTLIQGGKVVVTGLIRTSGTLSPLVELVDEHGTVVGYRQAVVTLPADPWATQGYGTFTAEVPYTVSGPTWVRLDVSSFEDTIPGPSHLSSLLILLGP